MMDPRISRLDAETAHKVVYRIKQRLRSKMRRLRADPTRAELSNQTFLNALDGSFGSAGAFLKHIRARSTPRFFVAPALRDRMATLARERFPGSVERAIYVADQACDHVFDLLGSGPTPLGDEIDWHTDFKTGWRWEPGYYTDVDYFDLDNPYDVKVPWELSRFHHAVTLGQAYWYSGDEKYARGFCSQVDSWLSSNPAPFGVNWTCTMEVAIRAVNWIWGYHFFLDSPELSPRFHARFLKGLLTHGRHIFDNLEWGLTTNNHYLSNLVGLIYLGVMFPEFQEAGKWLARGLHGLEREIDVQVCSDGVDYEASTSYHRLVTELFLSAVLLCRLNAVPVSPHLFSRLAKTLEFVMAYTRPDGTVPLIGDADDGRLHKLSPPDHSREFVDHRYLLGVGAMLFDRDDFAQAANDNWEDAFWLSGGEAISPRVLTRAPVPSQGFPNCGVYVLRQGDVHLIIDAGGNGMRGVGGHAHNDALGLTLYAYDRSFLVDPGSYVYTADYSWRNHFRATAAHNVVAVDGREMQRFDEREIFRLSEDARPRVLAWHTSSESDWFDGEHYGYTRLPMPVRHQRQVYFDKLQHIVIIRDLLTGRGLHTFDLYFHFAPLPVEMWPGVPLPAVRTSCLQGANLALVPLVTEGLSVRIAEDWVSPSYGRKLPAPVTCFSKEGILPTEFVTALLPMRPGVEQTLEKMREMAWDTWQKRSAASGVY